MQRDRRHFLKVLAGSTAAVSATCVFGCSSGSGIPSSVDAGNVSNLPVGTLRAVDGNPVAIGRDDQGVYALTLVCTHQGCDIGTDGSVSFGGITCNCHGSQFDANGDVTRGPADAPLQHYEVTIDASGEITIHGDTAVDAATRVAVTTG